MPKVYKRSLSPGELAQNSRLAAVQAVRAAKQRKDHKGTGLTIIRPSRGSYGEIQWSPDNC